MKIICRSDKLKNLDQKLNESYQKVKALDKTDQSDLKTGQKLWLSWLEKYACDLNDWNKDSKKIENASKCLQTAYEMRIKELAEGDLGYKKTVIKSYSLFDLIKISVSYPGVRDVTLIEFNSSLKNSKALNNLFKDYLTGVKSAVADRQSSSPPFEESITDVISEEPDYISIQTFNTGVYGGARPMVNRQKKVIDIKNAKFVELSNQDLVPRKALKIRKKIFDDAICSTKKYDDDECVKYFCQIYATEVLHIEFLPGSVSSTISPHLDLPNGLLGCEDMVTKQIPTIELIEYFKKESNSYRILRSILKK